MALDIGKTSGLALSEPAHEKPLMIELETEDLIQVYDTIEVFILKHKPDLIIFPTPTRFFNVLRKHFQYIGIVNYLALKHGIRTIEVVDARAKKTVLGSGKATKEDIMARYEHPSEHVCDALMFLEWYISQT